MAETPKPAQMSVADIVNNLDSLVLPTEKRQTIGPSSQTIEEAVKSGALPPGFIPYEDGDEWLYGFDVTDKAKIKALMSSAGLYGRGITRSGGGWTRDDATAFAEVLAFANGNGIDNEIDAARKYAEQIQREGPAARAPREPLVTRLANPEAVRQVVRSSSLNLLGRRLSDEEEQRLVSGFRAQHAGAQGAEYGAGGEGGSYTEALTSEEYMTSQLQGTAQAGDQRYLDGFEKILQSATSTMVEGPDLTGKGGVQQ